MTSLVPPFTGIILSTTTNIVKELDMTAFELIERLQAADPDARVVFLPYGADEDELEDVGVVEVFPRAWTSVRRYYDRRVDEFLYSGSTEQVGGDDCERVERTAVKVVVLSVDTDFLASRNFVRHDGPV